MLKSSKYRTGGILPRLLLFGLAMGAIPLVLLAQQEGPSWWYKEPSPPVTSASANDYAAVNQGQVKNIAVKAVVELDEKLPGGAGDSLHVLATRLSSTTANTNDYAAVNLGQLKAVAAPFYDRLLELGYQAGPLQSGTYPWVGKESSANDYAMANIGQVKNLFSFNTRLFIMPVAPSDVTAYSSSDGSQTIAWSDNSNNETGFTIERSLDGTTWTAIGTVEANATSYIDTTANNGVVYRYRVSSKNLVTSGISGGSGENTSSSTTSDPDKDTDGDGLTNAEEVAFGTDPNKEDTDADGVQDGADGWAGGTDPSAEKLLAPKRLPISQYAIIDIGPGNAIFVNDNGQAVIEDNDGNYSFWDKGTLQTINAPSGFAPESIDVVDMNNSGTVLFNGFVSATRTDRPFIWSVNGDATPLDTSLPGMDDDYSTDITEDVVDLFGGCPRYDDDWYYPTYTISAEAWRSFSDIDENTGTLPTFRNRHYRAYSINDSGTIVGSYVEDHLYIYCNGYYNLLPRGLGLCGVLWNPNEAASQLGTMATGISGTCFWPYVIGNSGIVLGTNENVGDFLYINQWWDGDFHAMELDGMPCSINSGNHILLNTGYDDLVRIWVNTNTAKSQDANGQWQTNGAPSLENIEVPGALGVSPTVLNDAMQAVGGAKIWQNYKTYDLNSLVATGTTWTNVNATGINNKGVIAASAANASSGESRAVLLLPVEMKWEAIGSWNNVSDNQSSVDFSWGPDTPATDGKWMPGRGKRIFPDKQTSDDLVRNRLALKIHTAANVTAGNKVYLKTFDVADATPSAFAALGPINSGQGGNDNKDTQWAKTGQFYIGGQAKGDSTEVSLDANGDATVIFETTMKPGDNFRVALAFKQEDLTSLQVTDPNASGYVSPDDKQPSGFNGGVSPMLTVWRKLNYELDRVARPTFKQNTISGYWSNVVWRSTHNIDVDLDLLSLNDTNEGYEGETEEYNGGWIKFHTENGDFYGRIISYTDNWYPLKNQATVRMDDNANFGSQSGAWFELSNDQISESDFRAGTYGSEPVPNPDMTFLKAAYAPAYIEPYNNPAWNNDDLTFKRWLDSRMSIPLYIREPDGGYSQMGEKKSIEGADGFKKVTIAFMFQSTPQTDTHPASTGLLRGITLGYTPIYNWTTYDNRCAVFWTDIKTKDGKYALYAAHEIGHILKKLPGHTSVGWLMDTGAGQDNANPPSNFHPIDIKEFRTNF